MAAEVCMQIKSARCPRARPGLVFLHQVQPSWRRGVQPAARTGQEPPGLLRHQAGDEGEADDDDREGGGEHFPEADTARTRDTFGFHRFFHLFRRHAVLLSVKRPKAAF